MQDPITLNGMRVLANGAVVLAEVGRQCVCKWGGEFVVWTLESDYEHVSDGHYFNRLDEAVKFWADCVYGQ